MGKVPEWAMPLAVYSVLGGGLLFLALWTGLRDVGVLGAIFGPTGSIWVPVVGSLLAAGFFGLAYRSWKRVNESWKEAGLRMCPECGRLGPIKVPACTSCGHHFA